MKLDSNFSGFSVNSASFNNQVDGNGGSKTSSAGGAKKVCCGRGCCQQGRQKISLDNLSTLLKSNDSSLADAQNATQEKSKQYAYHSHHGKAHFDFDLNKLLQNTVKAQAV